MNIKSIEPLEFVDNEALTHVKGGVSYRWIGSQNGKHTDTSAWHLKYETASTNAKNHMALYPGSVCRVYNV
ncbi:ComC/BlpC family peptide pheromone/bacteriocin [Streptococcus halichoeri]|uniref:ComC/BlpC family peptide pheromone/bacteriocin n=1 Tax=Streptococcus halichoeri TaxID=254785 RepID=UPI0039A56CA6